MTPPQHSQHDSSNSAVRLSICAMGICVCYMYYGMIQESLFSRQKIGPSFVLLLQCFTNSAVARTWQSLDGWMSSSSSPSPSSWETEAAKKKNDDMNNDTTTSTESTTITTSTPTNRLHHPLLALTALCYVSAMVCSNEALHYVSYPTAVLAKSCKLIPTMAMGVLVEHKIYQQIEWMAALCITLGIAMFNLSRLGNKKNGGDQEEEDSSLVGLALLSTSLLMDGFLGSCQGLLKQKRSLSLPSLVGGSSNRQQKKGQELMPVRPPNAVETMLFVNLYAIVFLIPLTIGNQQMAEGLAMLQGSISSSVDPAEEGAHRTLLIGLLVINMTVAVGQIFIFLTVNWYSSLVCTTITTTRKFFTILLSVMYFGHHFTALQWAATGLVFAGLYLGIMGQRANPRQQQTTKESPAPVMGDFSTTHYSPRRATTDASKMD